MNLLKGGGFVFLSTTLFDSIQNMKFCFYHVGVARVKIEQNYMYDLRNIEHVLLPIL